MPDESTRKDEVQNALDELYKDGRKPTLQDLAGVMEKHNLKLIGSEFPSLGKRGEKPTQLSQEEFEFYLVNRLRLAELEKTLAVNYGEIKGALDTAQAVDSYGTHYTTIKWMLEDNWLFNLLGGFKNTFPDGARSSTRLLELNALVLDTMQFIKAVYPDRGSYHDPSNAEKLKDRLEMIGNAIGEIRSLAEARLISSVEEGASHHA
jgi:hypothetical protein